MNEGKSTIASNIALAFANNGIKTVLIDCDLRRGMIHKFFSLSKKAGLSDYILSCEKSDKVIQIPPPLQSTEFENLSIISSGSNIDNPQKLLHSPVIYNLKEYLIQEGFFIVFDSPPIGITADAALLCKTITNYVFVIKAGQTNVIRLHKILLNDYSMINNNILGIVLNMGQLNDSSRYYCYY
jgi:capsular exopolysaccharide synthesis family protein